jgi:hypothetical protein
MIYDCRTRRRGKHEIRLLRTELCGGAADTAPLHSLVGGFHVSPLTIRQAGSWPRLLPQSRVYLCRELVSICLMGARVQCRNAASECGKGPNASKAHAQASILETDRDAAYSSLRRKKSHSLSGDSSLQPRLESEQLCARGAIKESSLLACLDSKPSLPLADLVTCLTPTATAKANQSQRRTGEGMWGYV